MAELAMGDREKINYKSTTTGTVDAVDATARYWRVWYNQRM
jgi:hypothetical protein